jgi:hypothetical protein
VKVKVRERKGTYRHMAFGLLTLFISTSLAFSAFGGQYEVAKAAYKRGDFVTAYRIFKAMTNKGDASGQNGLGLMYAKGQAVPQDYAGAVRLFRRAAEQGNTSGQNNLGIMYAKGHGVQQDYILAYMWFALAASAIEGERRDLFVRNRDRAASKMTPAQIAEAERLAREWKPKKEGR